jgi:hypothetical protein
MHSCFVAPHSHSLDSMVNLTPVDCKVAIELCKCHFGCLGQIVASCSLDLLSTTDKGEPTHVYVKRGRCSCMVFIIPADIQLVLKDDVKDKFRELTICVASSLIASGEAVQNVGQAVEQLGPGLSAVNTLMPTHEAVQNTSQAAEPLGPRLPTVNVLVSTCETVQNASQAAEQLGPGVLAVNDTIQAISPLATEIAAQFNAWQPLLSRLGTLVKVADEVAEAHFILKLPGLCNH